MRSASAYPNVATRANATPIRCFSQMPLVFPVDQLYFVHGFLNPPYPVDELPCAKVHCQPLDNRQVSMALRGRGTRPAHSVLD